LSHKIIAKVARKNYRFLKWEYHMQKKKNYAERGDKGGLLHSKVWIVKKVL